MTPEELSELERLAEAATEGPWAEDDGNVFSDSIAQKRYEQIMRRLNGENIPHPEDGNGSDYPLGFVCNCPQFGPEDCDANSRLIAASRTAIPRLIARVRELEELVDVAELRLRVSNQKIEVQSATLNAYELLCKKDGQ